MQILEGAVPQPLAFPDCAGSDGCCAKQRAHVSADVVIFVLLPQFFLILMVPLWINRAKLPRILLLEEEEPISNRKYSNQNTLKI